jgi:RimJ/RimL family protein N-acetyltransferase
MKNLAMPAAVRAASGEVAFTLRPPHPDDVAPYTAFLADSRVSVWLDDSVQRPLPATRVEAILLREAWCLWAIQCDSRFVGVTSLYDPDTTQSARFSVVIGEPRRWGRGLGTAVTRTVMEHAFVNLGLRKVKSDYLVPNEASRRIHERTGFVEEGRLRADAWREGRWVDRVVLSLFAEEWTRG